MRRGRAAASSREFGLLDTARLEGHKNHMPFKSIVFIAGFAVSCLGALRWPLLGVLGYMAVYLIDVHSQWWVAFVPVSRLSLILAVSVATGFLLNWTRLARHSPRFGWPDVLLLTFLATVWLSAVVGLPMKAEGWYELEKVTKFLLFLLILRRIVTSLEALDACIWCLVLSGLYMAWQAFTASDSSYRQGRLESIGGGDFSGINGLTIHLAATLPLAAVLLLRFRRLWQRGLVLAMVVLTVNTAIQGRSRSGFLAMAAGLVAALLYSPRKYRIPLVGAALLGVAGFFVLADRGFWERMKTIEEHEQDRSATGRMVVWRASGDVLRDHPLGVGIGNFEDGVRNYLKDEADVRDSHSTYVTCYTELGIQGAAVLAVILLHAWRTLGRAHRIARSIGAHDLQLLAFAFRVSLVVYLAGGLTMRRVYAEAFWWFLVLPDVLMHLVGREQQEAGAMAVQYGPDLESRNE